MSSSARPRCPREVQILDGRGTQVRLYHDLCSELWSSTFLSESVRLNVDSSMSLRHAGPDALRIDVPYIPPALDGWRARAFSKRAAVALDACSSPWIKKAMTSTSWLGSWTSSGAVLKDARRRGADGPRIRRRSQWGADQGVPRRKGDRRLAVRRRFHVRILTRGGPRSPSGCRGLRVEPDKGRSDHIADVLRRAAPRGHGTPCGPAHRVPGGLPLRLRPGSPSRRPRQAPGPCGRASRRGRPSPCTASRWRSAVSCRRSCARRGRRGSPRSPSWRT